MPAPSTTGGSLMGYPATVDSGGVVPQDIGNDAIAASGGLAALTANKVYLYAFEVQASIVVASMACYVNTGATGTTDMGIYDNNGNLLGHTGAVTNVSSTTNINNLIANLPLSPGQYFLALCPSNAADGYLRMANAANVGPNRRCRTANNLGTSGVLPATTGGHVWSGTISAISAIPVGGLS